MSHKPPIFVHGSAAIGLDCEHPEIVGAANSLFQSYRADETARTTMILRMESRGNDNWVLVRDGVAAVEECDGLEGAIIALEYELTLLLLRGRLDIPHLHGSGFRLGRSCILVLGGSGSGKSSLALAACVAGRPVFGDDVVLVDSEGRLKSFRRLFEVDAQRLAATGVDPPGTPCWFPQSQEAWFDPATAGGWVATPEPVDLIVVAGYAEAAATRVRELPSSEVALSLTRSVMNTGLSPERSLDILIPIAARTRGVELRFGDAAEALDAIAELINA